MKKENLYGLVLAGGKSTRMGKDKGQIPYHGIPQSIHLYDLVKSVCENTYLSIRSDQEADYTDYNTITDQDQFRGPFNGLLSAHTLHPEVAWLVVACDLPLLDLATIQLLVKERNQAAESTALATRKTGLPEPLAAIWEASALKEAAQYLRSQDSSCPRKYLLKSNIKLVVPSSDDVLLNANVEEEYLEVMQKISTYGP